MASALAATLAGTTAQAGLTHRYSFNNDAKDSIGTAHATLINGAQITTLNSVSGNGVYLNNIVPGAASLYKSSDTNGQYIVLPPTVLSGVKNLTLEFWTDLGDVVMPTAGSWSRVFDFGDPVSVPGQGRNFMMFTPHSGQTTPNAHAEFNLNQAGVNCGSAQTLEGYHHVVCTFDCTNGFMEVYLDGAQIGHNATSYQISGLSTNALWLGRSEYSGDEYLYGVIDEFRIYDRALSAAEAKADYIVGPDSINPSLTTQLGAVTGIAITDPGQLIERYNTNVSVTVDFANAPGLSLFNTPGFTLTSSATNVATIDGGGVIKALHPGQTTITASYSGKTATLQLVVAADTTAPVMTKADTGGYDRLLNLTFSKPLDLVSAQNISNYVLDGGNITVSSATLLTNNSMVVRLITSPFDPNIEHTAVVNNIKDLDTTPNTIAQDSTIKFGYTPGAPLVERIYYSNQGYKTDTLANGMINPGYPYSGGQSVYLANGLTDAGSHGDNYFSVINGWLVPPQTGTYTFYIASDDDGAIYVSSDDSPTNLPTVATISETGWAGSKSYTGGTGATRTGAGTVSMEAGKKYFFRAVHRNGTGGDNYDIAWQIPGAAAVANGDPAIAAQYIIPLIETNVPLAITSQPTNQSVIQSRPLTVSVGIVGTPKYTGIQWYKDGKPVANANSPTLSFANAALTNAGTYYAVVSNLVYNLQSSNAVITVTADTTAPTITSVTTRLGNTVYVQFSEVVDAASATNKANYTIAGETITSATIDSTGTIVSLAVTPKLTTKFGVVVNNVKDFAGNKIASNSGGNGVILGVTPGMISYWPLDTVVGTKTPDVVSGYDMTLVNLTDADLVPGHNGNAMKFTNTRNTLLKRVHNSTDNLPIYKWPQFTISLWVNGATAQNDHRVFSESSSKANNPMLNIGTTSSGGSIDIYSRNDSGTAAINHTKSLGTAYDSTWHHIVWIQNSNAPIQIYIDGVKDGQTWPAPAYPLTIDTTSIGGIQRASASAWFDGMIDDVAVWNRMLDPEEVTDLYVNGTPVPPPIPQPLAINTFKSDLSAVGVGDSVTLRWDVSKDADKVVIDPIGDVTALTVAGAGSTNVTLSSSVTYTITITRGVETLSKTLAVAAIGDVASGWTLLENFDRYPVGDLPSPWLVPAGGRIVDVNGNRMLSVAFGGCAVALPLQNLTLMEGQQATLFARMYLATDLSSVTNLDELFGLSDKTIRGWGDYAGNFGPGVRLQNPNGGLQLGTENGFGTPLEWAGMSFLPQTVYNVWIDIENDPIATGDLMTIYAAQDGDENRTILFQGYRSNRNPTDNDPVLGQTRPDLIYLIAGGNSGNSLVYFDDFYLSKSGYNDTVPHVFGYTEPVGGSTTPPRLGAVISNGKTVISWPKAQGTGFKLQSSTDLKNWNDVSTSSVDVDTNSTVSIPLNQNAEFYRLKK